MAATLRSQATARKPPAGMDQRATGTAKVSLRRSPKQLKASRQAAGQRNYQPETLNEAS
jgi:hypothetical protein